MNIEFHYYLTKLLALEAGFDRSESEIIAYSSQFVDDNKQQFQIETPEGEIYENYISQTYDITKPEKKLMRIYLLFHFMPGDVTSSRLHRRDGKMHVLMTSPANSHAQEIFFEMTKKDNPYALGIAAHMYSDTVSHQNFVGTFDEINALKGLWERLTPNIGHADAGYKPDIPNLIWEDPRLVPKNSLINNAERVSYAANKLYTNFLDLTMAENNWGEVKQKVSALFKKSITEKQIRQYPGQKEKRILLIRELLAEHNADSEYDQYKWFRDAIDQDVKFLDDRKIKFDPIKDKFTFKKNFMNSNWYKFQEAIKDYQKISTFKLRPILEQLEIREW